MTVWLLNFTFLSQLSALKLHLSAYTLIFIWGSSYCNDSNYSNHPIIRTPPPSRKMINYCIPSIRTPTFEVIIPISKHLHLAELEWGSPNVY